MPALLQRRNAVLPFRRLLATALPQTASIIARWSPDALTPVASGTALAAYADAVNGIALTQATGTAQPTYRTGGAAGKPYIGMSGAQAMRVATNATLAAGMTSAGYTVMAFYRNAVARTTGAIFTPTSAANHVDVGSTAAKADESTYGCNWGTNQFGYNGSVGSSDIQSIGWVAKTGATGAFNAMVLNGCIVSMSGTAWPAQDGSFGIGYTTAGSSFQGELYDVIIWSVPLTAAECLQVQKWACEKYGQMPRWVTRGRLDVACGDSQVLGANTTRAQTDNFFVAACKALGYPVGTYINTGQTGLRTDTQLAPYATAALDSIPALAGVTCNHVYLEWYNMRSSTAAAANLAYTAARKAAGYGKIALLTAYDSYDHPTARPQYIADLVSGYASNGVSDLIRVDTDADFGVGGSMPSSSPFGSYSSDGIHLNTAGNDLVRSRWVQPVMAGW